MLGVRTLRASLALVLAIATGAVGLVVLSPVEPASAAEDTTLYVNGTTGDDSTLCSGPTTACQTINGAVAVASLLFFTPAVDSITIQIAEGYYIEALTIDVTGKELTLQGAGAKDTVIDGDWIDTTVRIFGGEVTMSGLTITGGKGENGDEQDGVRADFGGGIRVGLAALHLIDSEVSGNHAAIGSGIHNRGQVYITRSTISSPGSENTIFNELFMNIQHSTIVGSGTTVWSDEYLDIESSTVRGGLTAKEGKPYLLKRSILDATSCGDDVNDGGYNVFTGSDCELSSTSRLSSSAGLHLRGLAYNGSTGPRTIALGPDSSARMTVPLSECEGTDQRGQPRPGLAGSELCDAGAFELQYTPRTEFYVDGDPGSPVRDCLTPQTACSTVHAGVDRAQRELRRGGIEATVHVAAGLYGPGAVLIDLPEGARLALVGQGVGLSTLSAGVGSTVKVESGEVELRGLSLDLAVAERGAGLNVGADGVVRLVDSAVTRGGASEALGEDAGDGGGIYNAGELTIIGSTVSGNQALRGGGIFSTGPLTIIGSTISGNGATISGHEAVRGGGIFSTGPLTIDASSIYGNTASEDGSALVALGVVDITASTIVGGGSGGVIYTTETTNVHSSTIADGAVVGSATHFYNSLLSDVTCVDNVWAWFSVVTDAMCVGSESSVVSTVEGIGLGPLAANGSDGPLTRAIGPTSSARVVVPAAECDEFDQRGMPRLSPAQATHCDAGAVATQVEAAADEYYIDANTGSDANLCTTMAVACKTGAGGMLRVTQSQRLGVDTITLHLAEGSYDWFEIDLPDDVTVIVRGAGAGRTVVTGLGDTVALRVRGGTVELHGLTLTEGEWSGGLSVSSGANVLLADSVVSGNAGVEASAIENRGTLTVLRSTVSGNVMRGGATTSSAILNLGQLEISHSTISENTNDVTVRSFGDTGVTFSTFGETSGDLVTMDSGSITVFGSILDGVACADITDHGYNVVTSSSCVTAASSILSTAGSIGLEPLAANGSSGPRTRAIDRTSPAHLRVPAVQCGDSDQRGRARPGANGSPWCDAGAYELQFSPSPHIYVNADSGSDVGSCATVGDPCRTIAGADLVADNLFRAGLSDVTIHLAAGHYTEAVSLCVPEGDVLVVEGAGAAATTVNAGYTDTAVSIVCGAVELRELSITAGYGDNGGGLLLAEGAKAQLMDVRVTDNYATVGAGVYTSENSVLSIVTSTFDGNIALLSGSAIAGDGEIEILNSTLVGNGASTTLIVTEDTTTVRGSTLAEGALYGTTGTFSIIASILSGVSCTDVADAGHNLVTDSSCRAATTSTLSTVEEIALAPLGDYGGQSPTMPPGSTSPAVQSAHRILAGVAGCPTADAPGFDQRGVTRPVGGACDRGAVELVASTLLVSVQPGSLHATVAAGAQPTGLPVPTGTVTFADTAGVIHGCSDLPVVDGAAACPRLGVGSIAAHYTSDNGFRYAIGTAGALASLGITPRSSTIDLGDDGTFTVVGFAADDAELGEVTSTAILTITPSGSCAAGACTPTSAGPHIVTATLGSLQVSAQLDVHDPSVEPPDDGDDDGGGDGTGDGDDGDTGDGETGGSSSGVIETINDAGATEETSDGRKPAGETGTDSDPGADGGGDESGTDRTGSDDIGSDETDADETQQTASVVSTSPGFFEIAGLALLLLLVLVALTWAIVRRQSR